MNSGVARCYEIAERLSRLIVTTAIVLCALLRVCAISLNISAQLVVAIIALAIGIPHGAVDHLVALPSQPRSRFIAYLIGYVGLAALSVLAIATWQRLGFVLVIAMSALHFGFGDAAFRSEYYQYLGKKVLSKISAACYAISAGLIPLILPLSDSQSSSALRRINPHLDHWAGSGVWLLRDLTLALTFIAIIWLMARREYSYVADVFLLLGLSLVATPLLTFAIYFGCWHATRHTARLIPKLAKAERLAGIGDSRLAFWAAISPGLYALLGTIAIAAVLMVNSPAHFSASLLWAVLVLVWGLTAPHMLTTARFDLATLNRRKVH